MASQYVLAPFEEVGKGKKKAEGKPLEFSPRNVLLLQNWIFALPLVWQPEVY